jgi:hypothetical protein
MRRAAHGSILAATADAHCCLPRSLVALTFIWSGVVIDVCPSAAAALLIESGYELREDGVAEGIDPSTAIRIRRRRDAHTRGERLQAGLRHRAADDETSGQRSRGARSQAPNCSSMEAMRTKRATIDEEDAPVIARVWIAVVKWHLCTGGGNDRCARSSSAAMRRDDRELGTTSERRVQREARKATLSPSACSQHSSLLTSRARDDVARGRGLLHLQQRAIDAQKERRAGGRA